eukprot:15365680-Ditylum_brightwellii.AAC.1
MDAHKYDEEQSEMITQSTDSETTYKGNYGTATPPRLSRLLPSKKELYELAREMNDVGVEYHKVGIDHRALLGYQQAVHFRMVASKIENCQMSDLADLSRTSIQEKYEAVKILREELVLKSADLQSKVPPLDLYHQTRSRTTFDHHDITTEKPICLTTLMNKVDMSEQVDTAVTLYNMGLVHQNSNRLLAASKLFSMALRVSSQVSHLSLSALILFSSAKILYMDGDLGRAARALSKTVKIYSHAAASSVSYTEESVELNLASAIALLGRINFEMKDYGRAAELCQQVLQIQCSVLGEDHVLTATSSYNLALVLAEIERGNSIQECIKLVKLTLQVLQTLGGLYLKIDSFTNSTQCFTTSLQLARKVASENPSDTANLVVVADSLFKLGQIFHIQGLWQAALKTYQEALQAETALDEDHKEITFVLCCLGQVYYELGDLDRAFEHAEHALRLNQRNVEDQSTFMA